MNKILKRLLTGVLTLATVFTALPTTAVHAAETQYWTESEERVGIVEKVMNDGSVEYVRGMPVVKAFNQTASSFARLEHAIKEYTEWVLKFSLGWQNYMPAFTTIINNIYCFL